MSMRDWMNNNPAIVTIGAVLVLVVCLVLIIMRVTGGNPSRNMDLYFYDRNTEKVFVATSKQDPPIETDSGSYDGEPAGVRIHIYGCGECDENFEGMTPEQIEEAEGMVGYLEKYTPDAKEAMQADNNGQPNYESIRRGHMVRPFDGDEGDWVQSESEDGLDITQRAQSGRNCPEGQHAIPCQPQ